MAWQPSTGHRRWTIVLPCGGVLGSAASRPTVVGAVDHFFTLVSAVATPALSAADPPWAAPPSPPPPQAPIASAAVAAAAASDRCLSLRSMLSLLLGVLVLGFIRRPSPG